MEQNKLKTYKLCLQSIAFLLLIFISGHMIFTKSFSYQIKYSALKQLIKMDTQYELTQHDKTNETTQGGNENAELNENIAYWINNVTCKSSFKSDLTMTSHIHSTIEIISTGENGIVNVKIQAVSGLNVAKTIGGDVFVIWAEQAGGDGRVAGHVIDNNNGSYLGIMKIYWTGVTLIKAKLLSTIENFCVRKHAILRYGDSAFAMIKPVGIMGEFQNQSVKAITRCGNEPNLFGYQEICNFTRRNDDSPWYCGAPKTNKLKCSDIYDFIGKDFNKKEFVAASLQTEDIKLYGHGELKHKATAQINIRTDVKEAGPCHHTPKETSWVYNAPSGLYLNKIWHSLYCKHSITFESQTYRKCLQNKTFVLFGDSTTREYTDYFMTEVLQLPKQNLKFFQGKKWTYHPPVEFSNFGISLSWKKHEMPFYGHKMPAYGVTSVPTEIKQLAKSSIPGKDIVIVIHYCAHMQAFSPDLFRFKMRRLANAIKDLLEVKPEANVFIKGPHIYFEDYHWFDVRVSLIEKDIIFEEFKDLKNRVVYLDIWSITVAHNSQDIHPKNQAFDSQIHQLMSYVCST